MLMRVVLPLVVFLAVSAIILWICAQFDWFGLPPQFFATSVGLLLATMTFVLNAWHARVQSRQQHTLKILFDTRLSPEFRANQEKRLDLFSAGEPVDPQIFYSCLNARRTTEFSDDEATRRRQSAAALRALLNYYEFLSLGILRKDLDEEMLRLSIRGIMCNLVVDAHQVIVETRTGGAGGKPNPRAFASLAEIYNRWRDPDQPEIPPA